MTGDYKNYEYIGPPSFEVLFGITEKRASELKRIVLKRHHRYKNSMPFLDMFAA